MVQWKRQLSVEQLSQAGRNTMVENLGIVIEVIDETGLRGSMPVDQRTTQPFGLLHGGASVALAETLGSLAGQLMVEDNEMVVGLEINANHLKAVRAGRVTGVASALHVGRRTQVWEIRISDEAGALVCVSRLTLAVVRRGG